MQKPRGAMQQTAGGSGRPTQWWVAGFLAAAVVVVAAACGGGEEAAVAEPPAAGPETTGAAAAEEAVAAPEASEEDSSAQLTPAGSKAAPKLTSIGDGPVPAGDLRDAYFHWKDETITVAAYPSQLRSPGRWRQRMSFGAEPATESSTLLVCQMVEVPEEKIASDTLVVLRGTFSHRFFAVLEGQPPRIDMEDCEVVSSGGDMPAGDPWTIGADPVPVAALHEAMFAWQGNTVKVVGYYHGAGYSSATDKTRVNLKPGAEAKTGVVGCEIPGKVDMPQSMRDQRDGVIVEGTLGEPGWDNLTLDDCRLVNRS
jgi:hypothetical protein